MTKKKQVGSLKKKVGKSEEFQAQDMNLKTDICSSPTSVVASKSPTSLCEYFTFHNSCKNGANCLKLHQKNVCLFYYQFGICKLENECKGSHRFTKNNYTKDMFEKFQTNWTNLPEVDKLTIVWTIQMIQEIGTKLCVKCFFKKNHLMNDKKNYFYLILELIYNIIVDGMDEKIDKHYLFYFLCNQNVPLISRGNYLYLERCVIYILMNYNDQLTEEQEKLPWFLLNELKTNQTTINHPIHCSEEGFEND